MPHEHLVASLLVAQEFVCVDERFVVIHDGYNIAKTLAKFNTEE